VRGLPCGVTARQARVRAARGDRQIAEERFNVTDVPTFFYIDRAGVIRYEARGLETHGEAADRVAWYIEELKRRGSP
jgi:hypothetical protein